MAQVSRNRKKKSQNCLTLRYSLRHNVYSKTPITSDFIIYLEHACLTDHQSQLWIEKAIDQACDVTC